MMTINPYIFPGINLKELIDMIESENKKEAMELSEKVKKQDRNKAARIIKVVFACYGVPHDNCASRTRKREYVQACQVSMTFIRESTRLSLAETGEFFRKDHATVLHAIKSVKILLDQVKGFENFLNEIRNIIATGSDGPYSRPPAKAISVNLDDKVIELKERPVIPPTRKPEKSPYLKEPRVVTGKADRFNIIIGDGHGHKQKLSYL